MKAEVLCIDINHPRLNQGLEELGFKVREAYSESKEALMAEGERWQGLVVRSRFPIDRNFLEACPNLRFIARVGAGLENIDLAAAEDLGIQVINAPEGNRDAVGEQAIGMLLNLFQNLKRADQEVRQGIWRRAENRGHELKGKTVGIIGFGNTGGALARKLSGFDCKVIAYDKYKEGFGGAQVAEVSLTELQAQADIVSLHIPQTTETDGMIDTEFIEKMAHPFYLINTARGRSVRTKDIVSALNEGKVLGAALDVLEYEKSSFEQIFDQEAMPTELKMLLEHDKVILSPHIAGWTHESHLRMAEVILEKLKKAIDDGLSI